MLQKEAFSQAAVPGAPEVNLTLPADAALPAAHASVLHLKPGEFSALIEDNAGFFIYKLDLIHRIPLEQKRAEIQEAVVAQKADFALRKIGESAAFTLNPLYFDSTPTPVSDQAAARPKPADRAVRIEAR